MPKPEKIIYTAHFVENRDELLAQIPPRINGADATIHAHHVTKTFRPEHGTEGVVVGKRRILQAIGEVATDAVHAVLVRANNGDVISDNEHPHLTIATAHEVPPSRSNEVIASARAAGTVRPIEPPIDFEVVEGYYNGKEYIKEE